MMRVEVLKTEKTDNLYKNYSFFTFTVPYQFGKKDILNFFKNIVGADLFSINTMNYKKKNKNGSISRTKKVILKFKPNAKIPDFLTSLNKNDEK